MNMKNDLSKTSPEGMFSNCGIYTLLKSDGYLLDLRQLKLLKPYAGILDSGKDQVEVPSNVLHKLTPSPFRQLLLCFSECFRG